MAEKKKKGGGAKARKVDPETQKKQFEEWKLTDEYIKWVKLCEKKNDIKKDYPHDVTETTEDLTGDWQDFEDKFFDFCKTFKVKTKLKELKHEYVRSFFFAKAEKDDVWFDGIQCVVSKQYSDDAWHLRKKFIEIWRALDEIYEYDHTTYLVAKKKMGKDLSEFLKKIVPHMKQPHKEIYEEKLASIIRPLSNLIKTNLRFSTFETNYDSPAAREIIDFKHKTLIEEFCRDFQECLRILHLVEKDPDKKIKANPDVKRIFNKLNLENWENNKVEFFYLSKLRMAFFTMRNHLIKLFVKGIDYWKIPLSNNQQFLEDVKKLIDCELISERLLGNELKRDQLNFVYNNLLIILDTPAKEKMLNKEELMTKNSIPKLLIFKTMQRMRNILDQKKKEKEKDFVEKKQGGLYFQVALPTIQEEKKENEVLLKSPSKGTQRSPGKRNDDEDEEKTKKLEEAERKKYGRYWIFEDYMDEFNKEMLSDAVEELRHINTAVQQDIQDQIITEGLNIPTSYLEHRELYKEEVKKTREFLDHLKMEDNKKDAINNIRPPSLWNHPKVWEDQHIYRSIAAPQECYKDNRIQGLAEKIEALSKHLSSYKKDDFDELISRVIDCFNNHYNPKPNFLSIY